jgi:hypothetical protein
MSHWIVRWKAIGAKAEGFSWLGGAVNAWRVILIALIGSVLGAIAAYMNGLDLVRDTMAVSDYTARFTFAVLVIVVVPAWLIRFITDLLPCSTNLLTAAYEDDALPKSVRQYAASQLRDEALARGAEGWVAIWEERKNSI